MSCAHDIAGGLADKESNGPVPRISYWCFPDAEKAPTSYQSLRPDLHETLQTAQQEESSTVHSVAWQSSVAETGIAYYSWLRDAAAEVKPNVKQ